MEAFHSHQVWLVPLWCGTPPNSRSRTHPGTYIQWNLGEEEWEWLREDEMGFLPPQFTLDEAWLKGCLPVSRRSGHATATPHPACACERCDTPRLVALGPRMPRSVSDGSAAN